MLKMMEILEQANFYQLLLLADVFLRSMIQCSILRGEFLEELLWRQV